MEMIVESKDGQVFGTVTVNGTVLTDNAGTIEALGEQMRRKLADLNVWVKELQVVNK